MSETKCPCCGDTISIFPDSGFYECDSCPFMCALEDFPRIAAAMNARSRHNALVEAVAWERECNGVSWSILCDNVNLCAIRESGRTHQTARAEVDRLIANESAADCKGEG